jgi:protoheme IX farnesyltransferase
MSIAPAGTLAASSTRVADFLELTKPRITMLVLITTAVGYAVAWSGRFDGVTFAALIVGTALVSGGASALNQYFEREFDGRMARTRSRPLPSGRLLPSEALLFGALVSGCGLLLLVAAGWLTFLLGAAALASYVFAYTPLKRVTSLCTVVGAVPGAIPPMMGWAAARGSLGAGAWALFGVLFLWQLPHFLAIGWMYREDYARGGFPMLTVTDTEGRSTGRQMVLYSAALLPVTLAAGSLSSAGPVYLAGALLLGGAFLGFALAFARAKSLSAARWLFLASVLYLPALLGLMVFDR